MNKVKKGGIYFTLACSALILGGGYYISDNNQTISKSKVVSENKSPNTRIPIHAELEIFSFEESVHKADLVAKVKISDTVKEFDEPSPKILFNATIEETLKGQINTSTIKILQQGNSKFSFNGNDLFKSGQEFILLLNKATGLGEDIYWILGEETQIYQVMDNKKLKRWVSESSAQFNGIEDTSKTNEENKKIDQFNAEGKTQYSGSPNKNSNSQTHIEQKKHVQILNEDSFKEKININQ